MAQIWSIGERKFGGNWEKRIMIFNVLVKSIFMYGVEIWGWEERENWKCYRQDTLDGHLA